MLLFYFDGIDLAIDMSLVADAQDHDVSFFNVKDVSVELILGHLLVHGEKLAFLDAASESLNALKTFAGKLEEHDFVLFVRNGGDQGCLLRPRAIELVDNQVLDLEVFELIREQGFVLVPGVPHPHRFILGDRHELSGD